MRQRMHASREMPEFRNVKKGNLNKPKHVAGKMVRRGESKSMAGKVSGWKGRIHAAPKKLGKK